MDHQVFISYATADKGLADHICGALETAGVACWIAPRDIEPGADYPAAIVEAVSSARVLVLILTPQAANSPHILSEVGHAFNTKKRIIPFRLSAEAIPEDLEYFLSLTQWLDAPGGGTEQNLKRLTDAVRDAIAGKSAPRLAATGNSRGRWLLAVVPALALAVGGVVYWKPSSAPVAKPTPASVAAIAPSPAEQRAKTWINPADGLTYVWIVPGVFLMGCSSGDSECKDDEKPAHTVTIEKGFWLGQTEVTDVSYRGVRGKRTQESPGADGALPATGVAWVDAKAYCAAAGGRLPTEAEWEYAARGGSAQSYYGRPSEIAWYAANSDGNPHPVGKKKPNAFGLYDMLGNVAEWVLDRYYNKYDVDGAATGLGVEQPLAGNALAVARGGFWDSEAASLRVSHRGARESDDGEAVGVRCARDQP